MSAKTKIVVLHRKELVYTGIFIALGIIFLILLLLMFLPGKDTSSSPNTPSAQEGTETAALYTPGIYSTEIVLGEQSVDIEVIVDQSTITSINMINLNDAVTTMYPLLEPAFDSIRNQVYELQTLEGITYSTDSKYTSLVLLEAIETSLEKAKIEDTATE